MFSKALISFSALRIFASKSSPSRCNSSFSCAACINAWLITNQSISLLRTFQINCGHLHFDQKFVATAKRSSGHVWFFTPRTSLAVQRPMINSPLWHSTLESDLPLLPEEPSRPSKSHTWRRHACMCDLFALGKITEGLKNYWFWSKRKKKRHKPLS